MRAADLFVKCLENEGVQYIFGIPGEENLDLIDALVYSSIQFITTRHEQGAAFMADVYGRLTGKAGVCISTLGPGATNLITGVASANMDHVPLIALAGQASTNRLHKISHQVLNLEQLFQPLTKYTCRIVTPETIPEIIRHAFKVAHTEKMGACFIEIPENIAQTLVDDVVLPVTPATVTEPSIERIIKAASIISNARNPIILAGNGVIRAGASQALIDFVTRIKIPLANTFMAKGVIPFEHPMALGSIGLQSKDHVSTGFDTADVIICIGYDIVEYHPYLWHVNRDRSIIHIDTLPADVDTSYCVSVEVVGDISTSLSQLTAQCRPRNNNPLRMLRQVLVDEMHQHSQSNDFPVKPQKIIWDLRMILDNKDIVICDVGSHKMWMARMFQCEYPNTCIISNGFASMGIAVPGAIAAKLAFPKRKVIAVTGDGGFLMNSQELETALRLKLSMVILIWNNSGYGLIEDKQVNMFGKSNHSNFNNPDFVEYSKSFGAKGYRVTAACELMPILAQAITDETVSVIDCPVDYSENIQLTNEVPLI